MRWRSTTRSRASEDVRGPWRCRCPAGRRRASRRARAPPGCPVPPSSRALPPSAAPHRPRSGRPRRLHGVDTHDGAERIAQRAGGNRHPRSRRPPAARGRGARKLSPQAGWVGSSLSGFMMPSGSKTRRRRYMKFRSTSAYCSGRFLALSRPTPCSPVMLPPRAMHAFSNSSLACLARSSSSGYAIVEADRADAGCRRRRETRWR